MKASRNSERLLRAELFALLEQLRQLCIDVMDVCEAVTLMEKTPRLKPKAFTEGQSPIPVETPYSWN